MSDEPSSAAAAIASSSVAEPHATGNETQEDGVAATEESSEVRKRSNRQMLSKKRDEFLDDLLTSLDLLVYTELSVVYYMDCSFLRFLFRAFIQLMFLTSKPATFPQPPRDRPVVGGILLGNLVCFLFHVWLPRPSAGEATRGYLHGGLAMDFIGQKAPTSKLHLVVLDLLIFSIQLVHMSVVEARKGSSVTMPNLSRGAAATGASTATRQDLDAEERGVRRSAELQDIELQELNPSGLQSRRGSQLAAEDGDRDTEHEALMSSTAPPTSDAHIFDAFNSGQIIIADLNVMRSMRNDLQRQMPREEEQNNTLQSQTLRAGFTTSVLNLGISNALLRRGA